MIVKQCASESAPHSPIAAVLTKTDPPRSEGWLCHGLILGVGLYIKHDSGVLGQCKQWAIITNVALALRHDSTRKVGFYQLLTL